MENGGDGRNRTDDPLLAKQVLYQLSYIPNLSERLDSDFAPLRHRDATHQSPTYAHDLSVVGQGGLEPPTPRLSSVCSNQLSY